MIYLFAFQEGDWIAFGTGATAKPYHFDMELELSPWQHEANELLRAPPDDRTIFWLWEPVGSCGKSKFQKWFCCKNHDAIMLKAKSADMKHGIADYLKRHNQLPRVIFANFGRAVNAEGVDFESYEDLSRANFFSMHLKDKSLNRALKKKRTNFEKKR